MAQIRRELQQREERRATARRGGVAAGTKQSEAREPAGMERDKKRVAAGIGFDRAEPPQPCGIAAAQASSA